MLILSTVTDNLSSFGGVNRSPFVHFFGKKGENYTNYV